VLGSSRRLSAEAERSLLLVAAFDESDTSLISDRWWMRWSPRPDVAFRLTSPSSGWAGSLLVASSAASCLRKRKRLVAAAERQKPETNRMGEDEYRCLPFWNQIIYLI
jgi:hypothetical protein